MPNSGAKAVWKLRGATIAANLLVFARLTGIVGTTFGLNDADATCRQTV
jgi:hypothetical protein